MSGDGRNIGILSMEFYFPRLYVDQAELEKHDIAESVKRGEPGWREGKYTLGLGQKAMSFVSDREDVHSLALTVTKRLLDRLSPSQRAAIGRVEVGTETLLDKSKSVKTVLMSLLGEAGVPDNVEGVDTHNACFGGTQAVFNSLDWLYSPSCRQRLALVVMADIAVYAEGAARSTGGAGAAAVLLGPDAPLVVDAGLRAVYMRHSYDFYKADLRSEYPLFDGPETIKGYLGAAEKCYERYKELSKRLLGLELSTRNLDGIILHTPYCKLVRKGIARLCFLDADHSDSDDLEQYAEMPAEKAFFEPAFWKAACSISEEQFQSKTQPALSFAEQLGNTYTSSVYGALLAFLLNATETRPGTRIAIYSYGSGLASAMYSVFVRDPQRLESEILAPNRCLFNRLHNDRQRVDPVKFSATLRQRESSYCRAPYQPVGEIDVLWDNSYYLREVDEKFRRFYEYKGGMKNGIQ